MQISETRLVNLALRALEEAAAEAVYAPVQRTIGLRLALAYLASHKECERWPFDSFWQALLTVRQKDRSAGVVASLNGIYLQLGIKRCQEMSSKAERDAQARQKEQAQIG